MSDVTGGYASRNFSLANPIDDRPDDLPYLLRRLADQIEQEGIEMSELLDVTITQDITANGPWWSATVYWAPA